MLVTKDGEATVYECKDGEYYYIVKSVAKNKVTPFDVSIARYDYTDRSEDYMVVIDGNDASVADQWITVNFVISAGSESKNYRLELWSGEREKAQTEGNKAGGAVLFDYSYYSISDSTIVDKYENDIIEAYQEILEKNNLLENIATSEENINYYKNLVDGYIKDGKIAASALDAYPILKDYTAYYYTFSLYDSANYVPFNADIAEDNQTGYDYTASKYSETLAYLKIKDGNNRIIFTDYSTIDQSFKIDTDEDDTDDGKEESDDTSIWLLVSSILLVVALLFTILSILIRDMVKKSKRSKTMGQNNYNPNKRNRYFRKSTAEAASEPADEEVKDESQPEVENTDSAEPAEQTEDVEPQPEVTDDVQPEGENGEQVESDTEKPENEQ